MLTFLCSRRDPPSSSNPTPRSQMARALLPARGWLTFFDRARSRPLGDDGSIHVPLSSSPAYRSPRSRRRRRQRRASRARAAAGAREGGAVRSRSGLKERSAAAPSAAGELPRVSKAAVELPREAELTQELGHSLPAGVRIANELPRVVVPPGTNSPHPYISLLLPPSPTLGGFLDLRRATVVPCSHRTSCSPLPPISIARARSAARVSSGCLHAAVPPLWSRR